eukprot:jgi/Chrzof1/14347/UNPLg00621.t1
MCGRARCSLAPEHVASTSGVPPDRWVDKDKYKPSYNLSPGHWAPIVRLADDGQPEMHAMKWGLVPSFTKPGEQPDHWRMFNARSETVATKSVFNRLLSSRRCVVTFNGFYEWKSEGGRKQPYYVNFGEEDVMHMAGLYDVWKVDAEGNRLFTFTILTVDSSQRLAWLHDRMPALLKSEEQIQAWLHTDKSTADVDKLLQQVHM